MKKKKIRTDLNLADLKVGDRVYHPLFGPCIIIEVRKITEENNWPLVIQDTMGDKWWSNTRSLYSKMPRNRKQQLHRLAYERLVG
ncbi:MAG: hypothetical protein KGL39_00735 [Patescibacteria group bacterium]|nr:hypothetical protein [Patescibacteria group bacterium]